MVNRRGNYPTMYGLADCNSFYVSCELLFRPDLRGKAVVVLSNNDGCVVSRNKEAKALNIPMAVPAYQIKDLIDQKQVEFFSSNYELYGDMSNRVMNMLSDYSPEIEIYSVDEAFLNLTGFELYNLKEYGREIVQNISKGTGIPISLGIGPTRTLAKLANNFAKKYPRYQGACVIDSEEKRIKALQLTDIGDVWGIGRRHRKFLEKYDIKTAYDFTQMSGTWVKQKMTIIGERTWKELQGISCMEIDAITAPRKSICTSRMFGVPINDLGNLSAAVSVYASLCAEKLRRQQSCASSLFVFTHISRFREDQPHYSNSRFIELPVPTNITSEIVHYALLGLQEIFREGFKYKKAGVIITGVVPDNTIQQDLFDNMNREKHIRLMKVIDKLNFGYNQNTLVLANQIGERKWKIKQDRLSPCYTTRLSDILLVKGK